MTAPLIECIPNISEGRRPTLLARFADLIRSAPGVRLLDYSADPAHNRSVYTMAGDATGLGAAVLAIAELAVSAIDLRVHHGEHPRIGALDVVPFVPLGGATMADCVALARATGRTIAERLQVPVFFYEEAAIQQTHRRLETIRRGQFEGLAEKMRRPEWHPDAGPVRPHPTAGAIAIGARYPLIAFNVNLATTDVAIARRIAAAVRESSGGLPFVKALGLTLGDRGLVQVSMNLTNYERTPIAVVFDRIAAEAERAGVEVVESELVGLMPAAAITPAIAAHVQLRDFSDEQILEHRLAEASS